MCSLTWLRRADGYELFFNRDESKRRLPGLPPALRRRAGVEFLAPLDADAGGTWLGINAFGLTLGLLNGASRGPGPSVPVSRGLLVLDLLDSPGSAEVARRLEACDLARRRPFELVALEPRSNLLHAVWDGAEVSVEWLEERAQPLSSSSLDPSGAAHNRRGVLAAMLAGHAGGPSEELLLAFHASHLPERGALSPCMHRDDAETVSFARTRVGSGVVELGYSPEAPCRSVPLTWLALDRAPAPGAASTSPRRARSGGGP